MDISCSDEFSKDPSSNECSLEDEKPIEPISDIGIDRINDIMFNNATKQSHNVVMLGIAAKQVC